jgi:dihydrofolate reductase
MHTFASAGPESEDSLGAIPKVVFSSTLEDPLEWANSRLIRGDAVEAVRALKEENDTPLTTLGSLALSRSLLAAGLVDRFRVVVFPVVTGVTGRQRIYDGWPDVALDLIESRTFDGRIQLLDYRPRLLDAPIGS